MVKCFRKVKQICTRIRKKPSELKYLKGLVFAVTQYDVMEASIRS